MADVIQSAEDIDPADKVELRASDPETGEVRGYSSMVQDVTSEGIAVTMPADGRVAVPLKEGTSVVVSIWKGFADHRFSSRVLKRVGGHMPQLILLKPAPEDITRTTRREYFRVDTWIPTKVRFVDPDVKPHSPIILPAMMLDLSAGGCRLQTSRRIGMETSVCLDFDLPFPPDKDEMDRTRPLRQIPGKGRWVFSPAGSRKQGSAPQRIFALGVQFDRPDSPVRLAILRYVAFRQRELVQMIMADRLSDVPGKKEMLQEAEQKLKEIEGQLKKDGEIQEETEEQSGFPSASEKPAGARSSPSPAPRQVPMVHSVVVAPLAQPSGKTILVVDDEEPVRKVIAEVLQAEGHQVLQASNGKEGLEIARAFRIDLVITDLMMPVMNGWRLLTSLREEGVDVPEVILTNHLPREVQDVLLSKDISGFLVKPIQIHELEKRVSRILFPELLGRRQRILAVDDEEDSLLLVATILQKAGFEVEAAQGGLDALEKVRHFHPDLILLDIVIPRMDGFEVCRQLRAQHVTAEIPVIMLTAKTSHEYVRNALVLKVNGYIVKPFDPDGLVARIRKVLQGVGKA